MTVQIANAVSMTFSCNSRQSCGVASESFESFLETGNPKSTDVQRTEPQAPVSEKQSEKTVDKQEIVSENSTDVPKSESTSSEESIGSKETDAALTNPEIADVELPEEKELTEDILAEILSILNEFVSVLQNELQITEQQLSDVAAEIQFGLTDFFDADRMKELFLHVNHVEASELLTDESLYKSLEQLQSTLSEALENSELYQLLQQEGFEPEQFDVSAFVTQISEFVFEKAMPEDVVETVETIETVIEFDNEWLKPDNAGQKIIQVSATEDGTNTVDVISENESGTDGDMMNQFSSPERGQEQAGLFLQKLVSAVKETVTESIQSASTGFELYDIASQIIEQVKLQIRPDNAKMEIQLNPEHLGKVELEVSTKNGELSARLNVQNDQVKEAVESQMQVLRDTLEAQGLKVENIEVTVAEFGFRFQDEQGNAQQFQQEQHRRNSLQFDETDSEEQSFSDVSEVMKELNGNSVDYVA